MENSNENSKDDNSKKEEVNTQIRTVKVSYLWKKGNNFICRNRIIKSNEKNINIPILNTYDGIKEILVQPRHIGLDPFKNDDSLLIMSDIFDAKGNKLSNDKRSDLIKLLNAKKTTLEENTPRFSFSIKVTIQDQEKYVILENIAETLTNVAIKSRININQYYFENQNTIVIESELNNCLDFLDEFVLFEYILFRVSKILDFKYKINNQFSYKFLDANTTKENGLEKLNEYYKKLDQMNVIIPETVERLKQGFLIDNSFTINNCLYESFIKVINALYE
jgi:hypothetical protein